MLPVSGTLVHWLAVRSVPLVRSLVPRRVWPEGDPPLSAYTATSTLPGEPATAGAKKYTELISPPGPELNFEADIMLELPVSVEIPADAFPIVLAVSLKAPVVESTRWLNCRTAVGSVIYNPPFAV